MKKITLLLFTLLFTTFTFSQSNSSNMEWKKNRLYYGDLKISIKQAKKLCLENNNSAALEKFEKVQKMGNWNAVWAGLGAANLISFVTTGNLINLTGSVAFYAVTLSPARSKKLKLYIKDGVDLFNK